MGALQFPLGPHPIFLAVACLGLNGRWKDILLRCGLVLALLFFIALAQTRSAYVGLALCIALLKMIASGGVLS